MAFWIVSSTRPHQSNEVHMTEDRRANTTYWLLDTFQDVISLINEFVPSYRESCSKRWFERHANSRTRLGWHGWSPYTYALLILRQHIFRGTDGKIWGWFGWVSGQVSRVQARWAHATTIKTLFLFSASYKWWRSVFLDLITVLNLRAFRPRLSPFPPKINAQNTDLPSKLLSYASWRGFCDSEQKR